MLALSFAGDRLGWGRNGADYVGKKKVVRWTIWGKVDYILFDSWA